MRIGVGIGVSQPQKIGGPVYMPDGTVYAGNLSGVDLYVVPTDSAALNKTDADAYVAGLTFGGHSDWRVPTLAEADFIVYQKGYLTKAVPGISQVGDIYRSNTAGTSSGRKAIYSDLGSANALDNYADASLGLVRAVRGS